MGVVSKTGLDVSQTGARYDSDSKVDSYWARIESDWDRIKSDLVKIESYWDRIESVGIM